MLCKRQRSGAKLPDGEPAGPVATLRKGEVQQIGTPRELYAQPRNLFVAGFIGSPSMNFLPAEIRENRLILPLGELALPAHFARSPSRRSVIAGIRPEHLQDAALIDAEINPASSSR